VLANGKSVRRLKLLERRLSRLKRERLIKRFEKVSRRP